MDTNQLLDLAQSGDSVAVDELLTRYRHRLKGMVRARMDPRVGARVDPSDVVQESLFEAASRMDDYLNDRPIPFYAWLRQFAWDKLGQTHRKHLKAEMRSVTRERIDSANDHSRLQLVQKLAGSEISPSGVVQRQEQIVRLQHAVRMLSEEDQELLFLRYVEQLSPPEAGAVLGINPNTFSKRHMRVLQKLKKCLDPKPNE